MSVLGWYDGPLSTDPETPIPNEAQENQLHMQRGPAVHLAANGAGLEDEPQSPQVPHAREHLRFLGVAKATTVLTILAAFFWKWPGSTSADTI